MLGPFSSESGKILVEIWTYTANNLLCFGYYDYNSQNHETYYCINWQYS